MLNKLVNMWISTHLRTAYHRDPLHRLTPNDIHDIDAMGSALPYCDIVVTDKAMASHVRRTNLAQRLDTIILWPIADLLQSL